MVWNCRIGIDGPLMKKERAFTIKVLSKYLRTNDMDLLTKSYDVQISKYQQIYDKGPTDDDRRSEIGLGRTRREKSQGERFRPDQIF